MKTIPLPSDFLMSSATAAAQIEGGDTNSNWCHWSQAGIDHYRAEVEALLPAGIRSLVSFGIGYRLYA